MMTPTAANLRKAADIKDQIAALNTQVESLLSVPMPPVKPLVIPRRKKYRMSADGRARIAAAAKRRWAKAKRAGRNSL